MVGSKFTDIFIRKPVLATVICLLILLLGVRSYLNLQVRQFPRIENTVVTVTTPYPGASSNLIQGFITTPLEKKIASAEGIDYMTSESSDGVSVIQVYLELNFDPDIGFNNVLAKVQETIGDLPRASERPILRKEVGGGFSLMYAAFQSSSMSREEITDYVNRVVQPKLATVPGTAEIQVLGGNTYAMRIWLDRDRMAGLGVSPSDVYTAIQTENVQAAAGATKSRYIQVSINPKTDLMTADEFGDLVIKTGMDGSVIRLGDVAKIELGSENYDSEVIFNDEKAVFIGVSATPKANPLDVIAAIRDQLKSLEKNYPEALKSKVVYDSTKYIQASINEVAKTILEATLIVIAIIFLFLGSVRSVLIPVVTIPLSLIGVGTFILFMGYSVNLLTLLALVLAIGMVVDDAIVVVENIYRHIEEGLKPRDAALKGASEIAMPIVAMTVTLAAVYSPIIYMGGLTGALFKEFAFTLAAAVIISGVIALTLSPMLCSKVLTPDIGRHRFVAFLEHFFKCLDRRYKVLLEDILNFKPVIILLALVVLVSCVFLYANSKKELAPTEDQGIVFARALAPQTTTLNYLSHFMNQIPGIIKNIPDKSDYFMVSGRGGPNQAFFGVNLKVWNERVQSQQEILQYLQMQTSQLPALQIQVFPRPAIPVSGFGLPIQFELTSTLSLEQLYPLAQQFVGQAMQSGRFAFLSTSIKFDKPEYTVNINRDKAAQMGIGMLSIGNALATAYGENYVNWFAMDNRNYRVIPQLALSSRETKQSIKDLYVQTASKEMIPLSTIVSIDEKVMPNKLTRFQQLNSVELIGTLGSQYTLGQGLDYLSTLAQQTLPKTVTFDYAGESRQYIQESGGLMITFIFALIIIYLVLAAQFENFRDPLVILTSVPMAICGALLAIDLGIGGATINIYTQIGLITLIGLITKHGILIVEFANQLQRNEGQSMTDAIVNAASIRLRPVLMTSFSMIFGVIPLLLASGAGAVSRFNIGLVIAAGLSIGTIFTLMVVPVMYTLKTRSLLLFMICAAVIGSIIYMLIQFV